MGFEYFIFYTEASVVCVLILLMILFNDRRYHIHQEKQIWFQRTILAHILYFITDACWAAVLGGQLPATRPLVVFLNLANYILMSLMAYDWFIYMAVSEKMSFRNDRRKRALCYLPMVLSTLTIVIAYLLDPYFWITESGEVNGLYSPMQIAAPCLYLVVAFICSVINARRTEKKEERRLYWLIGIYPLGVIACGLLQVFSVNAPTFCFGCTIMLLFSYIQNMQMLISVDALTRLNNRGQIERFMDQVRWKENVRVFIMMLDVDRFKQINDSYGHAEGDRALVLVSSALKRVCERIDASAFLGRYGGDEFTVILMNPEEKSYPARVTEILRAVLSEIRTENELPYELNVSVGYDELRDKNDSMQACMVRADEKLYEEKRAKQILR